MNYNNKIKFKQQTYKNEYKIQNSIFLNLLKTPNLNK